MYSKSTYVVRIWPWLCINFHILMECYIILYVYIVWWAVNRPFPHSPLIQTAILLVLHSSKQVSIAIRTIQKIAFCSKCTSRLSFVELKKSYVQTVFRSTPAGETSKTTTTTTLSIHKHRPYAGGIEISSILHILYLKTIMLESELMTFYGLLTDSRGYVHLNVPK